MDIIYSIIFIDLCIIIHETFNYFISFKEQDFRKYFVQKVPLDISTILSIVIPNDTIYLIFVRAVLDLIFIRSLFILSLLIGLIETGTVYYILSQTIPKFQYLSTINRFIFHTLIYGQLLQLNFIIAIIAHIHIIYMSSLIRSNYFRADYYVKPFFTKFMERLEKKTRENIYAK